MSDWCQGGGKEADYQSEPQALRRVERLHALNLRDQTSTSNIPRESVLGFKILIRNAELTPVNPMDPLECQG